MSVSTSELKRVREGGGRERGAKEEEETDQKRKKEKRREEKENIRDTSRSSSCNLWRSKAVSAAPVMSGMRRDTSERFTYNPLVTCAREVRH